MSVIFADTSAFVRRYIPEVGSKWVQAWIEPVANNTIFISDIGMVEFVNVLARRQRENAISQDDLLKLEKDFRFHVNNEYRVITVRERVLRIARDLSLKHPLRTLDAIQLASALEVIRLVGVNPTLISGDQRLLTAAVAEGIPIDNPYIHPK